mmetsp:Transcript_7023/g.16766  ORF Transcript_7023/g.16766 Transcript_7023/m.16766 type:complete len:233 (+) Transcript_7023:348-1046(+)
MSVVTCGSALRGAKTRKAQASRSTCTRWPTCSCTLLKQSGEASSFPRPRISSVHMAQEMSTVKPSMTSSCCCASQMLAGDPEMWRTFHTWSSASWAPLCCSTSRSRCLLRRLLRSDSRCGRSGSGSVAHWSQSPGGALKVSEISSKALASTSSASSTCSAWKDPSELAVLAVSERDRSRLSSSQSWLFLDAFTTSASSSLPRRLSKKRPYMASLSICACMDILAFSFLRRSV